MIKCPTFVFISYIYTVSYIINVVKKKKKPLETHCVMTVEAEEEKHNANTFYIHINIYERSLP